ncbi:MAG: hypothetical protein JO222_11525, partial [Frankiales bacterium]|nr:hypothetical protein [Frankiales bacterium]
CQGGGAIHSGPILHISDSTFRSNKATVVDGDCCHGGGAILNYAALVLVRDTLSNNIFDLTGVGCCNGGGAVQDDDTVGLVAFQSTISGNQANFHGPTNVYGANGAGGIYEDTQGSRYVDTTISGNSTNISPGVFSNQGGGAILALLGGADPGDQFLHSTLASNSAPHAAGGAILNVGGSSAFKNTLIAGNTAATGADCANVTDGSTMGTLTSSDYNLASKPSTCHLTASHDRVVALSAIGLGALANNGGPTLTRALLGGSLAINGVGTKNCTDFSGHPVAVDQRNTHRPQGTSCDIGAFEFTARHPSVRGVRASHVTKHGATISGKVDANAARTTLSVQWGTSKHYKHTVKLGSVGDGTTYRSFHLALKSLAAGHKIHYRVVASNSVGTLRTKDATFRTPAH